MKEVFIKRYFIVFIVFIYLCILYFLYSLFGNRSRGAEQCTKKIARKKRPRGTKEEEGIKIL